MSTTITDDSPWRMTVSDEHGIRLGYAVLNGDPRDERTPDIWDVRVRDDKAAELVDGKDAARLSDTMHGCRTCHRQTHDQPAEAMEDGLRLKDCMDPLAEPVLYRGVLSFLDDVGGVHDFGDVGP